jgi:hypothetical protein
MSWALTQVRRGGDGVALLEGLAGDSVEGLGFF